MGKQGRPRRNVTSEERRVNSFLQSRPPHANNPESSSWDLPQFLASTKKVRYQILRRYNRNMPHELRFALEDISEAATNNKRASILRKLSKFNREMLRNQIAGGRKTAAKANERATTILENNLDLISRIDKGNLSVNAVATKIYNEWYRRGIRSENGSEKAPSIRSITRWLQKYKK